MLLFDDHSMKFMLESYQNDLLNKLFTISLRINTEGVGRERSTINKLEIFSPIMLLSMRMKTLAQIAPLQFHNCKYY